jgi:hypothetical protein
MGNGTMSATPSGAVTVSGLESGVAQVSAGTYFSCAVTTGGAVSCWGANLGYGLLGDGSNVAGINPVIVRGVTITGGDFDGDGQADIVWRNRVTGETVFWFMDGRRVAGQAIIAGPGDRTWTLAAIGDFNGDDAPDLVWRNSVTGQNQVWYIRDAQHTGTSTLPPVADGAWTIVAAADFNQDRKTDLLWRNRTSGEVIVWYMDGAGYAGFTFVASIADANWQIVAYNSSSTMARVYRGRFCRALRNIISRRNSSAKPWWPVPICRRAR